MKSFSSLFLVALLLFTLRLPAAAQAPAWQSAQAVAVATAAVFGSYSEVKATAVDAAGNILLAGNFKNTVILGSTMLTSLGNYDIFVAKFNPNTNQFVWAQRAGGSGSEYAYALAVSGTSVYVAGSLQGSTAGFGAITLTKAGADVGSYDMFVAKLTDAATSSQFVWAQRAGGVGDEDAYALAVSGTSVYVAGSFISSVAAFGPVTLTSAGSSDVFITKLTDAGSTGSFVWAQRAGSSDTESASVLAVSGMSVYVAGYFDNSAAFGPVTLTSAGSFDVFITKLTDAGSTGNFVWAQRAGGTGYDSPYALALRGTSVYVAGDFTSPTANFGPAILANAGLANTTDVFVANLTETGSAGNFLWAQRAGGLGNDYAYALAASGTNVYVAGNFQSSTAGFGTTILTNSGPASSGYSDIFLAKLTDMGSTGSFMWAQRAGGTGFESANALSIGGPNVYVSGFFNSVMSDFGTITLNNTNPGTTGFLATLTDPTLTATTTAAGPREPATLFPNPARHTATLRLPVGTAPAPLTLTDALGRTVRRYPAPVGAEAALDLRGLPAGLYLLRGAGPAQHLAVE